MGLKDCRVGALMAVSDLGRARRFYEERLGLVPGEQEQEGVRYFCAEGPASSSISSQATLVRRPRPSPAGLSTTSNRLWMSSGHGV
jgi:catechol 2,3-dioxygenase-like lactoylglutathione lyase family enzyme